MANEDKTFELMEKMYVEMNRRFDEVDKRFELVNEKLDKKADKEDIARLEYDINNKIDALFDGYKQFIEGIKRAG